MKLFDNCDTSYENPGTAEIEKIIYGLTHADESFAILEQTEQDYMQVSGTCEDGFVLEYREGSNEKHYEVNETLTAEEVIKAFSEYSRNLQDYKSRYTWEKTF